LAKLIQQVNTLKIKETTKRDWDFGETAKFIITLQDNTPEFEAESLEEAIDWCKNWHSEGE